MTELFDHPRTEAKAKPRKGLAHPFAASHEAARQIGAGEPLVAEAPIVESQLESQIKPPAEALALNLNRKQAAKIKLAEMTRFKAGHPTWAEIRMLLGIVIDEL